MTGVRPTTTRPGPEPGVIEQALRCARCDVAWRGVLGDACWVCGSPGVRRGDVRIVDDEPVA
ncbi:MAG: hypothetical protein R2695_17750 [Acidimicrobiales bacterium]